MKNNICPECGMPRIDCGNKGIKTINEIALEKKVERLQEQLNEANKVLLPLKYTPSYTRGINLYDIHTYLEKWGVK